MNRISRKLHDLEANVIDDDVKEDTCFLDMTSLPEAEKALHDVSRNVSKNGYEKTTPEQREILEHSCKLLTKRVFLLFRKMVKTLNYLDDSDMSSYFDIRLMWFLAETAKLGDQQLAMKQLEEDNANLDEDASEDKRIELEKTWEPLFSEKSFDAYERDVWLKLFKLKEKKENGE